MFRNLHDAQDEIMTLRQRKAADVDSVKTLLRSPAVCLILIAMACASLGPAFIGAQAAVIQQSTTVQQGDVVGVVTNEGGVGLSNVAVQVFASGGALYGSTTTGPNGFFGIEVDYGTYSIYVTSPGYAVATESIVVHAQSMDLGTIVLAKGLRLSTSTLSVVAGPGDHFTIPFTIANTGEKSEATEFVATEPEGWSVKVLDQDLEVTEAFLSSGQTLTLQLKVEVPLTIAENEDYSLSLTAIGATNASLDLTVRVQQSGEAIMSCSFPAKSGAPGDDFQFQMRISNPSDVEQEFDFSANPVPPGWAISIKSSGGEAVAGVSLGAGESVDIIVGVTTLLSAKEGNYSILFTAGSTSTFDSLPLRIVLEKPAAGVELTAIPPYEDVYAGSQARFMLKLSNIGGYDELLGLSVNGLPPGLTVRFEDASKQEITKIYVEAGQSSEPYVVVSTPKGATLGALNFTVTVASADANGVTNLTLNVLGLYEITVTSENFYTSLNVGGEGTFTLTLLNNGTQDIEKIRAAVTGTTPTGFTVTIDPSSVSSLRAGEEATLTFSIQTQSDVNAGNYYLDFNVLSDQTQAQSFTLQVGIVQETSSILYAVIIVVVAVVGLFMVYRKFGRR